MSDEKICFVISPIGDVGSDIRRRADQILQYVIEPACSRCGYTAVRADKISVPGNITSQVIQHVLDDPLVIADLTGSNGNVFYELAIRHAIKKPFIQLIEDGERIPFDISGMRTVNVNHHDLDSVHDAVEEIDRQIRSVEGKAPQEIESPITVALDFQMLRQSGNPEQRSIAEFVAAIAEIRRELRQINYMVGEGIERQFNEAKHREIQLHDEVARLRHSVTKKEVAMNELYTKFAQKLSRNLE